MNSEPEQIADLTRNQKLVLSALLDATTPQSAYTLLDSLRGEGLRAPLQIYRALETLMRVGLVHRLESLNSFVACQHSHCDRHETVVFTICNSCEQVEELNDEDLSLCIGGIGKKNQFALDHAVVELRGTCLQCNGAN